MASTERIFFAGVATTVLLIGAGFGGGVMLGKTAMAPVPETKLAQTKTGSKAPSPPDRVVLPAVTETQQNAPAASPELSVQADVSTGPQQQTQQPSTQSEPQVASAKDLNKQDSEKDKQTERHAEAEKQKAAQADRRRKAAEKERRHQLYAERKARREAVRQEQEQLQQAEIQQRKQEVHRRDRPFGIVAFDDDDDPANEAGYSGD